MSGQRDMWIREWRYNKTTSSWMEILTLYDDDGEWVDSVSSEEFIQLHYYLKEHIKSHDDYASEVNRVAIPDYSHLYDIAEDDSIDSPMYRSIHEECDD